MEEKAELEGKFVAAYPEHPQAGKMRDERWTDLRQLGSGSPLDWPVVPIGQPLFPNLVQRPPSGLTLMPLGGHRWWLGFTSMVDSRGPGIVWIRGYRRPGRVRATGEFLAQLRRHTSLVAWLNPMPRDRWSGTSARILAGLVPMFPMEPEGLGYAVDVLRGLSPPHPG